MDLEHGGQHDRRQWDGKRHNEQADHQPDPAGKLNQGGDPRREVRLRNTHIRENDGKLLRAAVQLCVAVSGKTESDHHSKRQQRCSKSSLL